MRLAVTTVETVLFLAFVSISAYSLTQTSILEEELTFQVSQYDLGSRWVIGSVGGVVLLYGLLRAARGPYMQLRLLGTMGIVVQLPAVFSYNRLEWLKYLKDGTIFVTNLSSVMTAVLFLVSLLTLVVIHRLIAVGIRLQEFERQGVDTLEQRTVSLNEVVTTLGAISLGLALTLIVVAVGDALGDAEALFTMIPWTVFTVGAFGATVVAAYLWNALRRPDPERMMSGELAPEHTEQSDRGKEDITPLA